MQISDKGLQLIKDFEGCKLTAYKCPSGVWTIGYGSTGSHVKPGMKISEQKAEDLLQKDVATFERCVDKYVTVPLNQSQFDALVSWSFNVGCGALQSSTLLKKLNAGDYSAVPEQLKRWDKAGGTSLAGLTRRRDAEADLFMA